MIYKCLFYQFRWVICLILTLVKQLSKTTGLHGYFSSLQGLHFWIGITNKG